MARRVFYSFDYERDSWRASMVRNIGAIKGKPLAWDNTWEAVKRKGDAAIRKWIDAQLNGRSCTIVLIGAETATRHWVNYEIEQSWQSGKGLLGIRIHRLLDQHQQTSDAGPDPFTSLILPNGKPFSSVIKTYEPSGSTSKQVYNHISQHLAGWIETAIAAR
jgi:hypothetical protein